MNTSSIDTSTTMIASLGPMDFINNMQPLDRIGVEQRRVKTQMWRRNTVKLRNMSRPPHPHQPVIQLIDHEMPRPVVVDSQLRIDRQRPVLPHVFCRQDGIPLRHEPQVQSRHVVMDRDMLSPGGQRRRYNQRHVSLGPILAAATQQRRLDVSIFVSAAVSLLLHRPEDAPYTPRLGMAPDSAVVDISLEWSHRSGSLVPK